MARTTLPSVAAPDASMPEAFARSRVVNLLVSMRPGQWTKNLLLFAGVLFGNASVGRGLFDAASLSRAFAAFVIFCALSAAVYLINDVLDRKNDRRHPLKAKRPIASGALDAATALTAAGFFGAAGLGAAFALGPTFGIVAAGYLGLQSLYSGPLKRMVIIDVLTIAAGFVLRAVAGAIAVNVEISHWLLVCTVQLALFIALAKRRHELTLLADGAIGHRPILVEYSPSLLDQMIAIVASSTVIAYAFYTISPETQQKFGTDLLGLTIPFPLYGIFRYLYLVHRREGGGSPADLLLTDRPLLACVAFWALAVAVIIYRPL
jgi:4-hydroxybenzoate polyprenyltransferase